MAHFGHHQPLDDEELRMSLDEDMRALEALGAEDPDVDMNMDMDAVEALNGLDDQQLKQEQLKREELGGDDGDVFRPSAMLDRRMEEEWVGGAFYSTCFQASELVEKDLDGGFVDIEQMLLSESEEFLTAHFANTSDDQLHAQLLDGTSSGDQSDNQQHQRMIRAEITARHFLHAKRNANGDNDSDAAQLQQQRLVLLKQAIASSSLSSSSISNMPPKYFEGGVESSPQKRRAYRRTFGEHTQPFAFGSSSSSSSTFGFKQEDQQSARMTSDCYYQINGNSSTFNDENCPPHPSAASSDEVRIKEEIVDASAHQGVPRAAAAVYASESEIESMDEGHGDEEELKAAAGADSRAQTPVTLALFTGFRSISDDLHQYNNDEDEHEVTRTTLRTPLRRSLSSPAPSIAAEQQFTPQQQQHLSGGYASRSMSPADAFEKVAVVLQVAKDSPGRVDKFEWRIGGSAQTQNQQQQQGSNASSKKRPNLSMQLGKADAILSSNNDGSLSSCPSSELDENITNTTAATATLPPRYFRGVTSSPQKRRAHSTTFGSFARSFSFTGSSGPPNDL